jgi:hypothetical protein
MAIATPLSFVGTDDEQALARRVWELMTAQATLYARDSQIKQSLENIAAFFAQQDNTAANEMQERIDRAVLANSAVFGREDRGDTVIISTTRQGKHSADRADTKHTFAQRLYEPANALPTDDISNVVTMVRPPLTTVEPVQVSIYWRTLVSQPAAAVDAADVAAAPAEEIEAPAPEAVVEDVPQPAAVTPEPVAATTDRNVLRLPDGTTIDLNLSVDELIGQNGDVLQRELARALDNDPLRRVVGFGPLRYNADALPGFGKNDLRRIRDYIVEQGEPATDAAIAQDVYRERPGSTSFDVFCFGLNQRLSREKDFEFVGTAAQRQWSAKGLATLGSKRVKASDLGPFYAHVAEGFDGTEPADGQVLHYLSFFEWEYGVLPLNRAFASLVPEPLLPDQQSVIVRVETPQHYAVYLAEVRYPRANRGGWIWGLEEFFREYLVPGALVTLAPGNEIGQLVLTYEDSQGVEERLLHLEEKRNRFVFLPTTYYVAVDDDLLLSQRRYGKFRNLKPLPMNDRKKFDVVLEHVFETVGEQLGTKQEPLFWVQGDELLLAVNVLRPTSREYLLQQLEQEDAFTADDATPGAYYFKPAPEESNADEDEDDVVLDDTLDTDE